MQSTNMVVPIILAPKHSPIIAVNLLFILNYQCRISITCCLQSDNKKTYKFYAKIAMKITQKFISNVLPIKKEENNFFLIKKSFGTNGVNH